MRTTLYILSKSSCSSYFSFVSLSIKNVLPLVIRVVSTTSKSPFLLSLALFQLGFAGIRPSALKDLTVVAEGLVALYHCSALAMVNSLLLSKITSSVTLEDHSSCQHE